MLRIVGSIVVLTLGVVAFYLFWPRSLELPQMGTVTEWPFTEVNGKEVSHQDKPKLVTFFFTSCPDVCPMTFFELQELQVVMQEKGIADDEYIILAVTLDPEYDTGDRIRQYVDNMGISSPNWLFLRGTEEETKQFAQYFHFTYAKSADGFVTHSTSMYIVDPQDRIRSHHDMAVGTRRVNIEEIADHLEQFIK
ncbi:SCO family protein [Sporosarcina sp. 179-K 3D1 HS]|uniref:SCO family protein n=1 Tax=Sporosarcina sp. 179-K 3D1 HS TaxID=3232169 RepID=UPI0039A3E756